MKSLNISLAEQLRDWVDQRIASGEYSNASDYIGDLIRHDQSRRQSLDEQILRLRDSRGDNDALDYIDAAFTPE